MEEETQIQEDLLQEDAPMTKPLEAKKVTSDVTEIHPKSSKWLWFITIMVVILVSFGIAWFILEENDKLSSDIESGAVPQTEKLTNRAFRGIGESMMAAKDLIEKNGDEEHMAPAYLGQREVYSQIENWEAYSLVEDKEGRQLIKGDSCDNEDQDEMASTLEEGDVYELEWSGPTLMYVPNAEGMTNEAFMEFKVNCSAGGVHPLYAYEDKLLFAGSCSAGVIPEEGTDEFDEFASCVEAESVVKAFFMNE